MSAETLAAQALRLLAAWFLLAAPIAEAMEPEAETAALATAAALEDGLFGVAEAQVEVYLQHVEPGTPEHAQGLAWQLRALSGQEKYAAVLNVAADAADALKAAGHDAALRLWSAAAHYGTGDPAAALALLADFAEAHPDDPLTPSAMRLQAKALAAQNRIEEALTAYRAFAERFPADPQAAQNQLDVAKALMALERTTAAREVLNALIENAPDRPEAQSARAWLARSLAEEDRIDEALALHGLVATSQTANAEQRMEAWMAIADLRQAREDEAGAIEALETGLAGAADAVTSNHISVLLGQVLLRAGQIEAGTAHLKDFITADPTAPLASTMQLKVAQALLDAKHFEQAATEFQQYLEAFNDQAGMAEAYEGKGWSLLGDGTRLAEAAAAFEKAYSIASDEAQRQRSLFKVGDALSANGQYKRAMESYRRLITEFPESDLVPQAAFQVAECIYQSGQSNAAAQAYADVVETHRDTPYAPRALLRMAELHEKALDHHAALIAYERVIREYPESEHVAEARVGHSLLSYKLYRFEEALNGFTEVLETSPESSAAEYAAFMAGTCRYMMYQIDDAMKNWSEFLARYPESPWAADALYWIGKHEYDEGAFQTAESNFLAVATRYPKHELADDALFRAGRAALDAKEYLRSIEHFTRLVRDHPNSPKIPEARFFQGDALCGLARFPEAILIFEEIIAKYPDHYIVDLAWRRKGDCQFSLGGAEPERFDQAVSAYKTVIRSPSAAPDLVLHAEYMIGRCEEQRGRTQQALEQYYRVVARFSEERAKGVWQNDASRHWFTRAAYNAYDILHAEGRWRQAVMVLKRIEEAKVPASKEARERIDEIRSTRWWIPH